MSGPFKSWDMKKNLLKLFSVSNWKLICSGLYNPEIWIYFVYKVLIISYIINMAKVLSFGILIYSVF